MTYQLPDGLQARILALMEEVYRAGFHDGSAQTRAAIMRAVSLPEDVATKTPVQGDRLPRPQADRAARGAGRAAVRAMLSKRPGLTLQEMENILPSVDPALSPRTLGGELHRQKGRLYEQQGSRWFLKHADLAAGTGGTAGAAAPAAETGDKEGYDAAA